MGKARAMKARQGSGRVPHKPLIDLSRASLIMLLISATESIHYRTNQRLFGGHLSETDADRAFVRPNTCIMGKLQVAFITNF